MLQKDKQGVCLGDYGGEKGGGESNKGETGLNAALIAIWG